MVTWAFIFLAIILLLPIMLIVLVLDFVFLHRSARVRRGFDVIPVPEPVKKP